MNVRVLALFFLLALPLLFGLVMPSYSQQPTPSGAKVVYDLPYPGITSDNPLYIFKEVRDNLVDFFTRDLLKKADLYLHYSDKNLAMALTLEKQGKNKQAIDALRESERYASQIPDLLNQSKKQGVNPSGDMILTFKLSNSKHQEVIQTIQQSLPGGEDQKMGDIIKLNQDTKEKLSRF